METKILLEIILTVLIIIVLAIIVVNPSIIFGRQQGEQISFREFCFRWSVYNYPPEGYPLSDGNLQIDTDPPKVYNIREQCAKGGVVDNNIENCIRLCRGSG